jgi:hypothetical protein
LIASSGRWLAAAALVASCSRNGPPPEAQPVQAAATECAPAIGTLKAGTTAAAVAGKFNLTLVATSGPFSGRRVAGNLDIPSARSAPGVAVINLDTVGAVAPGPVPSDRRYSVEVVEWSAMTNGVSTPQITLRLGTQPPSPPGTQRIEGAYMALHVNAINGGEFSGRWESGSGVGTATVGGHFCAK